MRPGEVNVVVWIGFSGKEQPGQVNMDQVNASGALDNLMVRTLA